MFSHIITYDLSLPCRLGLSLICAFICGRVLTLPFPCFFNGGNRLVQPLSRPLERFHARDAMQVPALAAQYDCSRTVAVAS